MIEIHPKYEPLYELLQGKHPEVDTVIITGGRYSAKSYNLGLFALISLVNYGYSVLFTRYTNTSIVDSIKPNVDDKIGLLNYQGYVNNTSTHIERNKNRIAFKGIKTGSHQQTANLKSLENFNVFIVDEADEMPDYDTFEKVFLSIRSIEKRNITILSLNPSSVQHWIFKDFYKKHKLKGGENVIRDNVMYIHTSYLDLPKKFIPKNFLTYYENLKKNNEKKYNHVVLGKWVSEMEGQVHKHFEKISYIDYLAIDSISHYSLDFGTHDPTALVEWKFVIKGENDYHLYFHEKYYLSENETLEKLNSETINREDGGVLLYIMNKCEIDKNKLLICDTGGGQSSFRANDFKISLLKNSGYNTHGAFKWSGSIHMGNELLKNVKCYYTSTSENIEFEIENYTLDSDREGFIDGKYIDKNNHLIDAMKNVANHLYKIGLLQFNS